MLRLFENNHSDLFLFFAMMRIEPRASCILGKYSTVELYPSPKTDYCHYDCCCVCFCGMHVCIHGHMVVLTSTWGSQRTSRPHVFLDCPPLSLLSSGFRPELADWATPAGGVPQVFCLYRPMLDHRQAASHAQLLCGFWGSKLQSSCLCDKGFIHWASSPAQDYFFNWKLVSIPFPVCVYQMLGKHLDL